MNKFARFAAATAVALALVSLSALPANAAGLKITYIKNKVDVGVSLTFPGITPALPDDARMTIAGKFSEHKANSVRLKSFIFCYQEGPAKKITVHPMAGNIASEIWEPNGWVDLQRGQCKTWYPNKVYKKKSNGEVVRITAFIDGSKSVIAGFYR